MRYLLLIFPILLMGCAEKDRPQAGSVDVAERKGVPVEIVEATYGLSCKDFVVTAPAVNTVSVGNATSKVAADCQRTSPNGSSCTYTVSVGDLGDPAPVCAKDFDVKWRCGTQEQAAHLDGESNTKSVTMSCA
jgi:hypothetical protein